MPLKPTIARLIAGEDLDRQEAADLMSFLAKGEASPEQVAGLLVALQAKGVKAVELAGFADVLRANVVRIGHSLDSLIDTAGTGGGRTTFNLSTGAALVASAAGAKVAKHGNRSVTSQCGSADVLEALGMTLHDDPTRLSAVLDIVGIVFMFAPVHHGSMKAVGPVRKALGVRTVFNQLGPLANPAGAKRQLIGVYDKSLVRPMADALLLLGADRAFVVHSQDGLDEISPCAPTDFAEVRDGEVHEGVFDPSMFLAENVETSALEPGETIEDSASLLVSALKYEHFGRGSALVPNSAVALVLSGMAADFKEGAQMAVETMKSGAAYRKLNELVEATRT